MLQQLRTLKIELGLITPDEIKEGRQLAGKTEQKQNLAPKEEKRELKTVSQRLSERAIARLGQALRLRMNPSMKS